MDKLVHIVFGDLAAGGLRYFLKNNKYGDEIINIRDDYSVGPLYEIETEEGLIERIEWFEEVFEITCVEDYFEDIEKELMDFYEEIENIDKGAKVVIWHGENVGDQVGLRYLCSLFRNRILYEVNVSEAYINNDSDYRYKPRTFGECPPEEIEYLLLNMRKIEKERHEKLIDDWELIRNSKENLRILEDAEIIGVDESYYDDEILSNCSFNFKKAARIIGDTMGKSEQCVSDTYIDYRVRCLIESGQIEYRGKLEPLRDFEIKVSGSVNDFFVGLFKKTCKMDEDGLYHYLLEERGKDLDVDIADIDQWHAIDLSNKLIIDYDEANTLSLNWFKDGKNLISIDAALVNNIERIKETYKDAMGKEMETEAIVIAMESLVDQYLEIQIKPYISIALRNQ